MENGEKKEERESYLAWADTGLPPHMFPTSTSPTVLNLATTLLGPPPTEMQVYVLPFPRPETVLRDLEGEVERGCTASSFPLAGPAGITLSEPSCQAEKPQLCRETPRPGCS